MMTDELCIKILIVYDMLFAVVIGKCVYNFLVQKIQPFNVPSVYFVIKTLPDKRKEVRSMVLLLFTSAAVIFLMMPIFVFISNDMTLFYGICILTFVSIIYLMLFIHTMKKYEQLAVNKLVKVGKINKGAA